MDQSSSSGRDSKIESNLNEFNPCSTTYQLGGLMYFKFEDDLIRVEVAPNYFWGAKHHEDFAVTCWLKSIEPYNQAETEFYNDYQIAMRRAKHLTKRHLQIVKGIE